MVDFQSAVFKMMCRWFRIPALDTTMGCGGDFKKKVPATKSEIMAAIAEAAGISKKQAVAAYEKLLAVAYEGAKGPKGIVLPGLGKLIKAKSKARMGRNPATGAAIKIPARTKVKFRVAKAAKDAVLA